MNVAFDELHEIIVPSAEDHEGDDLDVQANLSQQILERLGQSPSPMSARELRDSIDCSAESLSKRLYAMRMSGRVLGTTNLNGGQERYQYSLPPPVYPGTASASLDTQLPRKSAPKENAGVSMEMVAKEALREASSSLESVLLGALPEGFHKVLKSYGRLCGLVR